MLDRLRFQEVEKAIFRVREDGRYGDKCLKRGEHFMVIDNASISNFVVGERDKNIVGRSTEAGTSTIKHVSFSLMNGSMMLNLFNSIFGETKTNQKTKATITDTVLMNDQDIIKLPSKPMGEVLLYLTDKVSVGTNFYIGFNNSEKAYGSTIYVQGLADDNQNGVNKEIFTIEVI